jgi:lysophospholipase L1-like esterase
LGDSVSWGDGIPDEENIYPSLLKKELRNLDPAKTYEVINASVPGYSTFQELRYLELYGLGLKPDMIVLQFCLNDIFERYGSLASYGGDNMFLGIDTRKAIPGITGFLVCHSKAFEAFFRWMQHKSRNRQAYSVNNLMKDSLSSELTTAFENTLAEIDGIRSVASKNNLPFLVFVPPYQIQLSDPANLGQPQKILTGYCLSRKVPFLDILPQFSVLANERKLVLFNDESHFSEAGHAVAAKMMAKAIDDVLRQKQTGPQKTPG